MQADSSHATEHEQIVNFWVPSASEAFFYFVISTIWFGITNATTIWQFFNLKVLGTDVEVSGDYSPLTAPVFNFINDHDTWIMLVVWGVIGCVVFGLVILFQNIFKTAKQEVAEARYRVGGVSANPEYWHNVAHLDLSFAAMALGWIVYLVMYLNGIMPWVSQTFFIGLNSSWTNSYKILIALLINTLALYLLVKFTKILASTWRLIRPNE